MKECSIDGCGKTVKAVALCAMHYQRRRVTGTTDPQPRNIGVDRFDSTYRVSESGCWEWTGSTTHNGYGQFYDGTGMIRAHRYAWGRENGPIPDGLVVDHLCHVRKCVNPAHMRLLTASENQQNRRGVQARNSSGYRGVYWDEPKKKWAVKVGVNGKTVYGGRYLDRHEAGRVAAEMRSELLHFSQN